MSELPPPLPSDGQSHPAPPLAYAAPGVYQRPKPRTPYIGRLAIGCFGYVLVTAGWCALAAIGPRMVNLAVSGWAIMTLALLGLSLYLRIRYGFSGVGVGILISLGVGVVITILLVVGVVLLVISICGKNNNLGLPNTFPATTYPATVATQPGTQPDSLPTALPGGPMSEDEKSWDGKEVLPYRSGSDDAPGRAMFVIMLVGGFVTSSVFVAVCGCAWVLCNVSFSPPTTRPSPLIWKEPLLATAVILMLLAGLGVWAHRTGKRAMLIGLLIGFGVSTLLEGICFVGSR